MGNDGSGMTGVARVELVGPDGQVKSYEIVYDEGDPSNED